MKILTFFTSTPLLISVLAACSNTKQPYQLTAAVQDSGFTMQHLASTPSLVGASKITARDKPLIVYIEGDGKAYASRSLPSTNPTPLNPVGWHLAKADPHPNVLYMARPCQYEMDNGCKDKTIWTSGRFNASWLPLYSKIIDEQKTHSAQTVELVGYSGGAAIALELAARRSDVASVRTVAGNLNPNMVNRYHRVDTMPGAIAPTNHSQVLRDVPQIHYAGQNDFIIPPRLSEAMLNPLRSPCVHSRTVPASHGQGWVELWPSLLREQPACTKTY